MTARLAVPTDRPEVAALLASAPRRHGTLALEDQVGLLSGGLSAVAFARGQAIGFLGLSMREPAGDPSELWVDVAMLALPEGEGQFPEVGLRAMVGATLPALQVRQVTGLICLTADSWLRGLLSAVQFVEVDQVISYARASRQRLPSMTPVASLRPAGSTEADEVLALNAAAFAPLWRYDPSTMLSWLLTADHAVLAELGGRPVGFALTTCFAASEYAHLVRIATHPAVQRKGIGHQLVVDAIHYAREREAAGLALNTQASNSTSRHMYESLGFRLAGRAVTVMVRRL